MGLSVSVPALKGTHPIALRKAALWYIAIASCAAGCSTDDLVARALAESALADEERTYKYQLVRGEADPVCRHMKEVYNSAFRRPWDFQDLFRDRLPRTANGNHYPHLPFRWTEDQLFLWFMRYSLFPSSEEFEAIRWTQATLISFEFEYRSPIRVAEIDIDNDGRVEFVVQDMFYGSGDGQDDSEGFMVQASSANLHSLPATITRDELYADMSRNEAFGGDIIRPFVLNGVTYLGEYEAGFGSGTWPEFRHVAPEKMWVKKYVGGQPVGQAMNAIIVCEFNMLRNDSRK
jgi:hypothetical protein